MNMRTMLTALTLLTMASCQLEPDTWAPVEPTARVEPEPAPLQSTEPRPTILVPRPAVDQDLEVAVAGAPELSGRFWAGDLVCLPPGARATLRPLVPGTTLALADAPGWGKAGGAVKTEADGSVSLYTPDRLGARCRLELRGRKAATFPVAILTRARVERSGQASGWRVYVGKEYLGAYPNPAASRSRLVREHQSLYEPPRFFLKIDRSTEKARLAPHLLAGQMVSFLEQNKVRTSRRHTLWFPPNRPLVEKLERLSRELHAAGVGFRRLAVNSGFRTPLYNARIGGAAFSRHIYGDAADVMIDENDDERMDDITGDRIANERDALLIAQALRRLELGGRVRPGGIGAYAYDAADSCAAFVHTDARGFITRWGTVHRRGRSLDLRWWPPEEFQEEDEE